MQGARAVVGPARSGQAQYVSEEGSSVGRGGREQGQDLLLQPPLDALHPSRRVVWPISLHKLKDDKHERITAHYLPEARVAYLDEIFKASSAILNSLLTILNEREFDNGRARVKVPAFLTYLVEHNHQSLLVITLSVTMQPYM